LIKNVSRIDYLKEMVVKIDNIQLSVKIITKL